MGRCASRAHPERGVANIAAPRLDLLASIEKRVSLASMSDAHKQAARELAQLVPQLRRVYEVSGEPVLPRRNRTAFEALARSIVFQQLAGAAARTIWQRVLAATGTPLSPIGLSQRTDDELRACGLSAAKLRALRDLSSRAAGLRLSSIYRAGDDEVIERLTSVRGIGRWTAEMFLIFHLRRLDVWPAGDLGVREGYRRVFGLDERPGEKQLVLLGEQFRPFRSVATWYLWRANEVLKG
jgi:DNA-3-methyladenine glycosylase II